MAKIVSGGTPSTKNKKYWDGSINWYTPQEIDGKIFLEESHRKISKEGLSKTTGELLPIGTVLFTSRASIGSSAILKKEASTNQGFQSIIPNKNKLDSYFIYSQIPLIKSNIIKYASGSTFLEISNKNMSNLVINIPKDFSEQKIIGSFFYKCDKLISLYQHKLKLLELIKKGLLQKLFVNNNFKYPEIRFKEFSDAWEKRKLAQEVVIHSGKDYKHLKEGPIPVYGTGGYMCSVNEALSYKDAVGIGRKGTINNPYLLKAPFWTVDTLFYVTPKHKNIDLYFILFTFKNINWNQKDESTGVPSLSKKNIYDTYISLPNYNNQIRISELFLNVSKLISLYYRELFLNKVYTYILDISYIFRFILLYKLIIFL